MFPFTSCSKAFCKFIIFLFIYFFSMRVRFIKGKNGTDLFDIICTSYKRYLVICAQDICFNDSVGKRAVTAFELIPKLE